MALVLLGLFLSLIQLSDSVNTHSRVCGLDRVGFVKLSDGYQLFVNEEEVEDKGLICEVLGFYSGSGCLVLKGEWGRIGEKYCDRDLGSHPSAISVDSAMLDISSASEKTPGTPFRVPPSPSRFSMSPQLNKIGTIHLSVGQIIKATQNFSPSLRLGEGGFGTVYKAVLPDGQVVAVKRAKKELFSTLRDEFSNEVELLTKIDHRNLVRLLGYTDKGNERIIITEYVPNGTLREHLDENPIIHRDVKSSNILLTESHRAKVSDFGFARIGPSESEQTHILTRVKGTAGYLDPEYLKTYKLTPKSDVFSFGILLIEIISGRRPVEMKRNNDERITVRWAFKNYNDGNVMTIIDPLLKETIDGEVVMKMLALAFQCAAPTRADRPAMKEVGEQLWEIRKDYGRIRRV